MYFLLLTGLTFLTIPTCLIYQICLTRPIAQTSCLYLLLQLTVTAHEAVNASCGVDQRALTSIERVRGV